MATSRPEYSWTFVNPDLEATKADQRPASKPSRGQESVDRARQADSVPGRRRVRAASNR
jgi:hypothetical protein